MKGRRFSFISFVFVFFFTFFLCLVSVESATETFIFEECESPPPVRLVGSVEREIIGSGFHRSLVSRVEVLEETSCCLVIIDSFPSDIFLDSYEISDKILFGEKDLPSNVWFYPKMDLEKPASQSPPHLVFSVLNPKQKTKEFSLTIPIHFRYQTPVVNGESPQIVIPSPRLYLGCHHPSQNQKISTGSFSSSSLFDNDNEDRSSKEGEKTKLEIAPILTRDDYNLPVQNITLWKNTENDQTVWPVPCSFSPLQQQQSSPLFLSLPSGHSNDLWCVQCGTIIVSFCGFLALSFALFKKRP